MHVTLNLFLKKNKIKFLNSKPTVYFLEWYVLNSRVLNQLSSQKLPKIHRRILVKLL